MPKMKLTDIYVNSVEPPANLKRFEVSDTVAPGLTLRVTPTGQKSFSLRYRDTTGRQQRLSLGRYPALSLKDARIEATKKRGDVAKGQNPAEEKRRAKVSTLSALVNEFIEQWAKPRNRTAPATERVLNNELVAKLGKNRDIASITRRDIIDLINKISKRAPSQARGVLAAIRKCFNWAVSQALIDVSPAYGVKAPAPASKRDRKLNDAELAAIWLATFAEEWKFNQFVRLLILTGQRRAQIANLRWSWVDSERKVINFPASIMKNKRDFTLPISGAVARLLQDVKREASPDGPPGEIDVRAFPTRTKSNTENALSGYSKAKARLDESSGVKDWTYHDFRRTLSTYLNGPGRVNGQVVESILSHIIPGVAGIYNQHEYVEEMRAALEIWAAHPSLNPATIPAPTPKVEKDSTKLKRKRGRPAADPVERRINEAAAQMIHSATREMIAEDRAAEPDGSRSTPYELALDVTAEEMGYSLEKTRRMVLRPRKGSQK